MNYVLRGFTEESASSFSTFKQPKGVPTNIYPSVFIEPGSDPNETVYAALVSSKSLLPKVMTPGSRIVIALTE